MKLYPIRNNFTKSRVHGNAFTLLSNSCQGISSHGHLVYSQRFQSRYSDRVHWLVELGNIDLCWSGSSDVNLIALENVADLQRKTGVVPRDVHVCITYTGCANIRWRFVWNWKKKKRIGLYLDNRPFYSCVLSYLAMDASEAGGDLALIQTSLLFSCKCELVSIRTTWFTQ